MVSDGLKAGFLFLGIVVLIMFAIIGFTEVSHDDSSCIGTWKNVDFSDQDTCMIFYENRSGNFIMKDISYPFTWKPTFGRNYDIYFINWHVETPVITIYNRMIDVIPDEPDIKFYKSNSEETS